MALPEVMIFRLSQTCSKLLLVGYHGFLLWELWDNRKTFAQSSQLVRKSLDNLSHYIVKMRPAPADQLREASLIKVRMKNAYMGFCLLQSVVRCMAVLYVLTFQFLGRQHGDTFNIVQLVCAGLVYGGFRMLLASPLTQRRVDMCYLVWSLLITIRRPYLSTEGFVTQTPLRVTIRSFVSVVYMKSNVSSLVNLLHALVECGSYSWKPIKFEDNTIDPMTFCGVQLLTWLCMTCLCMVTEAWFNTLLDREIAAKSAKQAVDKLLSGLCDTVVCLDSSRDIVEATPQLIHLMCPTNPINPGILEGTPFRSHLATNSDMERYDAFMDHAASRDADRDEKAEGLPPALRVNLHHELGRDVACELYHVRLEGIDRQVEHLIGVREVREQGVSPDESLFQGQRTSFEHSRQEGSPGFRAQAMSEGSRTSKRGRARPSANRALSSASSSCVQRKLFGLQSVRISLDLWGQEGQDVGVQEYSLRFSQETQNTQEIIKTHLPGFETLLLEDCRPKFKPWLHRATNELLYGEDQECSYQGKIWFRPPTLACASSKVILVAERARMKWSCEDDEDASLVLEFFDVSQILASHGSSRASTELLAIPEGVLSKGPN